MATTVDTVPATNFAFADANPADTITVADGPPENGFQTTEFSYAAGATAVIFANKTNFTLDGGGQGDKVFLDNPDPAAGLTSLTIQNLGTGSTITGVNANAGSPDVAVATLVMSAAAGIGTAARPLRTQTGTLNALTSTGGIFINNNAAASLCLASAFLCQFVICELSHTWVTGSHPISGCNPNGGSVVFLGESSGCPQVRSTSRSD